MLLKGKVGFAVGAILIVFLLILELTGQNDMHKPEAPQTSNAYEVLRVIDGDTIEVNIDGEPVTVRMIGIDCPESVHPDESLNTEYGEIAADFTRTLLEGKNVLLEYDEQLTDEYGRTLAYVYIEGKENGGSVNAFLLQEGYARVMEIEPNTKYAELFRQREHMASSGSSNAGKPKGFWNNYFIEEDNNES